MNATQEQGSEASIVSKNGASGDSDGGRLLILAIYIQGIYNKITGV